MDCDSKSDVLYHVKINGYHLQFASEYLVDDYDIVLAEVKSYGLALMYSSKRLKDDYYIVMEAFKRNKLSLQYASKRIQVLMSKNYKINNPLSTVIQLPLYH